MAINIRRCFITFIITIIIILIVNNINNDSNNDNIHRRMFEGVESFQYNRIRGYVNTLIMFTSRRKLVKELVKGSGKSIYVVENGILHHIPDWDTFIAYGFDLHNVKYISDAELNSYPVGEPLDVAYEEMTAHKRNKCPCDTSNIPDDASSILNTTYTPSLIAKRYTCIVDNTNAKKFFQTYAKINMNINIRMIDEIYANDIIKNTTLKITSGFILILL